MGRTPRIPAELTLRPFSLNEARTAGLTLSALRGRSWRRVGSGLYAFAGLRDDSLQRLQAWHRRLPDAVFTGLTAAWLNRLDVDPCHPVEVVVPPRSAVRLRPGLWVRNRALSPGDISLVQGLPATSIERTMRDLSKRLPRVDFLVLADEALRIGLGRFDALAEPTESPMETRLRWLLIEAGLPLPEVQTDLYSGGGDFLGRADLYFPTTHLVIEFDGANHRDRLISDDRRQNRLIGAAYRILRFTTADLRHRPQAVVAEVREALVPGTSSGAARPGGGR